MARALVIFDIDGTLVYSERRDSQCFAQTYHRLFRRDFPSLDWSQFPHVTDTTIFQTAFDRHFRRQATAEEVNAFQEAYLELLRARRVADPSHSREVPGARKAIEYLLGDDRFRVGIATGGWQRPAHLKLQHVGIPAEHIDLRGADGLTTREEILLALVEDIRRQGESYEHVVYLGDAVWDVQTTANLDMRFIGVRWRGDAHVLQQQGARTVLTNYLDFEGLLRSIWSAEPPSTQKSISPI